ncbi:MFS transporter [Streptomyces sp. Je 1-79]|uniref:MFS transporter n=1 Tax=Streptomyces sp. Je 1-79 TaxID=2943847 RepID=UPI0021A29674|nr:MFS transporter [Streptomyces sp. Je 1-79]MCT4356439.1 MFS transporter [Streptomyces sp. Je 1-79]
MPSSTSPSRTAAPLPVPAGTWTLRLWGLLFVLAGNMLIDALEVSVVVVALPSIGADLGLPLTSAQWTMTGFAIGFGGLMLFGGRVVALLGRRRVYLAALLGFAAASVAGALAADPTLLMATRVIKGFCAALTAPTGLAIISTEFPAGPARDRALSVYTLFGASGFTAGLLLSGALTAVDWRLTLAFPAPVVLVLFLCGLRLIPGPGPDGGGPPPGGEPRRYDVAGAATFAGGLLALVAGIVSVPSHGWDDPRSGGLLVLAALLFAAFALVERRSPQPLVRFSAFRGALARSALGAACLNGSYLGLLLVLTYQLQTLHGWSPLRTALAFLPAALPLAVTALLSGRLVAAFGAPRLIAVGALFPLAGYLLLLGQTWPLSYGSAVLPTMLLVGAGFVLSFAALNMQATSGLPPAERGTGSGLYQTAVQAAAAVVPAVVAALLTAGRPAAGAPPAEVLAACRPALVLVAVIGAAGLLTGVAGVLATRGDRPGAV